MQNNYLDCREQNNHPAFTNNICESGVIQVENNKNNFNNNNQNNNQNKQNHQNNQNKNKDNKQYNDKRNDNQ